MRKSHKTSMAVLMAIALSLLLTTALPATLIVDTGDVSNNFLGSYLVNYQWEAGKFSLTQDYTITEVQGLIGLPLPYVGSPGEVRAVLYSNNSQQLPGTELYSQTFSGTSPTTYTWQGPSGLNWNLTAGEYWLAFEVASPSQFFSSMNYFAPKPMSAYALGGQSSPWQSIEYVYWGFRVYGTPSAVPVPPAVWLFGSGLLGLVGWRRFRKS